MGIFSKSCEYALRAVCYIASRSSAGEKAGMGEIAAYIQSPEPFLAKILQRLVREEVLESAKGPHGGFYINKAGLKKPMAIVVKAIDGETLFEGCAMGLPQCSALHPCPLHHDFKRIRQEITRVLRQTSIGQFNAELIRGKWRLSA